MATLHPAVLTAFARLRAAWPHRGWSFDDRFESVASSFSADFAPTARELLMAAFPQVFDERSLPRASAAIRECAARTGGVRASQMIFGAEGVGRLTPYALWWPWEEAQTISLRVGIEGATASELKELCACFGIVD